MERVRSAPCPENDSVRYFDFTVTIHVVSFHRGCVAHNIFLLRLNFNIVYPHTRITEKVVSFYNWKNI